MTGESDRTYKEFKCYKCKSVLFIYRAQLEIKSFFIVMDCFLCNTENRAGAGPGEKAYRRTRVVAASTPIK